MSLLLDGEVAQAIKSTFTRFHPRKIAETGTFLGLGSTTIIASTLRDLGYEAEFYSIEVNPEYYAQARQHLKGSGLRRYVHLLNGLSVPRALLPGKEAIRQLLAECPDDIFDDLQKSCGGEGYIKEVDFPEVPDDLLHQVMSGFDFRPDFVLLDSAGHLGFIEFLYLLPMMAGPCLLALDDAGQHVKHRRTLKYIRRDERFRPLFQTSERYGFVIVRFEP
jgi:hypothetical protein